MAQVLPPQTQHGAAFELPRVRQFTVFLENKVGRLQALVRALEQRATIVALAIEESGDSALARLICAFPDSARELLKTASFPFSETELLVVQIPQRAERPLTSLCAALLTAEINIHYAYPLLLSTQAAPALALYVDDLTLAAQQLIKKGFTLLAESDLAL